MVLTRSLATLALLGFLAGCGEMPTAAGNASAKKKRKASSAAVANRPKLPEVSQGDFASLDAAMAEVETLSTDPEGGQKLLRIELWLTMQGDKIAPQLAALIKDPSAGLATRLTACRALARLGPIATPTLLEAMSGEPKQLRLKAIESLGRVKPPSKEVVTRLVALLDEQDYEARKTALSALSNVGPPAKEHDPAIVQKLMSILNDTKEDETIRALAKQALKSIDPRKGLMNAY